MNKRTVALAMVFLLMGAGLTYLALHQQSERAPPVEQAERKPLFYRHPMNPDVTSPVPAKDSMGMDYIPVYEDRGVGDVAGTVEINPVVQNNIGLRSAVAEKRSISHTIRSVGRVDYDEEKIVRLHPKVEGWIKKIFVDKTGELIPADAILLEIYSPKLVATQEEYLLALKNYETLKNSEFPDLQQGARELVTSSRKRLEFLDVPRHQIKELEETRTVKESLHIHSPTRGTVLRIGARQGQFVTPATELYEIVDLSTVWVYADIYEDEIAWVKVGDPVDMTLKSLPGEKLQGTVSYIYPYAQSTTRTTKVRLVFDNPDLVLRPEMFADVTIRSRQKNDVIVIPSEAVVRSGETNRVFVLKGEGVFEPRNVSLGIESGGYTEVLEGVQAGDRVVVSAQFLIDSESKLQEATAKMTTPDSRPKAYVQESSE